MLLIEMIFCVPLGPLRNNKHDSRKMFFPCFCGFQQLLPDASHVYFLSRVITFGLRMVKFCVFHTLLFLGATFCFIGVYKHQILTNTTNSGHFPTPHCHEDINAFMDSVCQSPGFIQSGQIKQLFYTK